MSCVSHECSKGSLLERFFVFVPVEVRNSVGSAGSTAWSRPQDVKASNANATVAKAFMTLGLLECRLGARMKRGAAVRLLSIPCLDGESLGVGEGLFSGYNIRTYIHLFDEGFGVLERMIIADDFTEEIHSQSVDLEFGIFGSVDVFEATAPCIIGTFSIGTRSSARGELSASFANSSRYFSFRAILSLKMESRVCASFSSAWTVKAGMRKEMHNTWRKHGFKDRNIIGALLSPEEAVLPDRTSENK